MGDNQSDNTPRPAYAPTKSSESFEEGVRYLVEKKWGGPVTEFTVLEISPSGGYLKVKYANGNQAWEKVDRWLNIVEKLPDAAEVDSEPSEGDPWEYQCVSIERGMLEFLCGEGPLLGAWFGDDPPHGEQGNYWWRKYLREGVGDSDYE